MEFFLYFIMKAGLIHSYFGLLLILLSSISVILLFFSFLFASVRSFFATNLVKLFTALAIVGLLFVATPTQDDLGKWVTAIAMIRSGGTPEALPQNRKQEQRYDPSKRWAET